jgi:rare lipoprotein A
MRGIRSGLLAAVVALVAVPAAHAEDASLGQDWTETGVASFYGKFWQGRRTASGERFDNGALTAAHSWLPFGTRVRVLVEETGREVVVTITDRIGTARRVIDLSQHAAKLLGIVRQGTAEVTLQPE